MQSRVDFRLVFYSIVSKLSVYMLHVKQYSKVSIRPYQKKYSFKTQIFIDVFSGEVHLIPATGNPDNSSW
jgi:hypothetical protein